MMAGIYNCFSCCDKFTVIKRAGGLSANCVESWRCNVQLVAKSSRRLLYWSLKPIKHDFCSAYAWSVLRGSKVGGWLPGKKWLARREAPGSLNVCWQIFCYQSKYSQAFYVLPARKQCSKIKLCHC